MSAIYQLPRRGIVVDDEDPARLGRVRVRIPGLMDSTCWAWPCGGGSAQRGTKLTPRKGSTVICLFVDGNPDDVVFLPGNWGRGEMPAEGKSLPLEDLFESDRRTALSPTESPRLDVVYEGASFLLAVDDRRAPRGSLVLHVKSTGDVLEYDGAGAGWVLRGTSAVEIQSDGAIRLSAPAVTINGRRVTTSRDPI